MSPLLLEHGDPIRLKPMTKPRWVNEDVGYTDTDGDPLTVKVKDVSFKCVSRGNMWCKIYFLILLNVVTALRYKSSMG